MGILSRLGFKHGEDPPLPSQEPPSTIDEIYETAQRNPEEAAQYLDQCIDVLDSPSNDERVAAAWAIKHIAFQDPEHVADRYDEIATHLSVSNLDVSRPLAMAVGIASYATPHETIAVYHNTYDAFIENDLAVVARDSLLIPFSRIAYRDPSAAFPHVDTLGQILVSGDRIGKQYAAEILGMVAGDNQDLVVPYTDQLRGVWSYHDRNLKSAALPALTVIATPPVTDTVPDWFFNDFTEAVQAQDDKLRATAVEITGIVLRRAETVPDPVLEAFQNRLTDENDTVRENAVRAWILFINDCPGLVDHDEVFAAELRSVVDEFDLTAENPDVVEHVLGVVTGDSNTGDV